MRIQDVAVMPSRDSANLCIDQVMSKKQYLSTVDQDNATIGLDGIPFGQQRQLLSPDIEAECLRFLDVSNLFSLFQTCRALSTAVKRFVSQSMRALVFVETCKNDEARAGLRFAIRHACRLERIRIDLSCGRLPDQWVCTILVANSATLCQIDIAHWCNASLQLLKRCSRLEHLHLARCSWHDVDMLSHDCNLDAFLDTMDVAVSFPRLQGLSVSLSTAFHIDISDRVLTRFLSLCMCASRRFDCLMNVCSLQAPHFKHSWPMAAHTDTWSVSVVLLPSPTCRHSRSAVHSTGTR